MSRASVTKVLIANRGEIAVRIIRACRSLDIATVAVYSDADRDAEHVRLADEAVHLGAEAAHESYLNIDRVIDAARTSGADAVHPGYGFLSENAQFVERCDAAGLTFIGPSAAAMRALGDKARAKEAASAAEVPTVPEWDADSVPDDAYPVLVKAAAGGGGRGMRRVDRPEDLAAALESAKREAAAGFGDDTLLVEKLVEGARHVEVQLIADTHGNAFYVGDRDCSLQRRHQKVVEEAPAPELPQTLRAAMGEATVRLAHQAKYVNAGTAEFLVDRDGRFYFLELNARLQVEHPVTEEAFGIDLAQWQLRIARGEALTLAQEALVPRAHSIEVRLYAEDPVTFLPTGGELAELRLPSGDGVRVDHALRPGMHVSLAYDPLLAKVIATAPTREEARRVLLHALREMVVLGAVTNAALLQHALTLPDFVAATHDTRTLEANLLDASAIEPSEAIVAAARRAQRPSASLATDPFAQLGRWRQPGLGSDAGDTGSSTALDIHVVQRGDTLWASVDGIPYELPRATVATAAISGAADSEADHVALLAPMPGSVLQVVEPGTEVAAGDAVVVIEAMKMETTLAAPFAGTVLTAPFSVGDLVTKGAVLAEVGR